MSYTPINGNVYISAYSGTLAGIAASDRIPKYTSAATYAGPAAIAGAFAQAFDQNWANATLTTDLQNNTIRELCESAWFDRTPLAINVETLNPANPAFVALSAALVAIAKAGDNYFTAQSISPNMTGSGNGNAVSLQGVSLTQAVAGLSNVIASDGVVWRSRPGTLWFKDFFTLFGGADDGVTDCSAALTAFIIACAGKEGVVSKPTVSYALTKKVAVPDDATTSNTNHVRLRGEDGWNTNGVKCSLITSRIPSLTGNAASIIGYSNGGSGKFSQLLDLGPGSGILAANKASLIGEWIVTWNLATTGNALPMGGIIVDVPADNQVKLSNQNTGATNTDANNGAIRWRLLVNPLDIRMRDFNMCGITVEPASGFRIDYLLQQTFASGSGAQQVIRNLVERSSFITQAATTAKLRDAVWLARSIVPRAGNSLYAGLNGDGDLQEQFPFQVDTMDYDRCEMGAAGGVNSRFGIAVFSRTGQSKENIISRMTCMFTRMPIGVPRTRWNGSVWSVDGNPQFSVYYGSFAACDTWVRHGATSSGAVTIEGCYGEAGSRIFEDEHGLLPQVVNFVGNVPTISATIGTGLYAVHPSGEIYTLNGTGPYNFVNGFDTISGVAANPGHISCRGEATSHHTRLNFVGHTFYTIPGWTRKPRLTGMGPGPYVLTGTEVISVTAGGVTQTVTCSAANFAAVWGAGAVDLNEAEGYQISGLIQGFLTNATSWADPENTRFDIQGVAGGVTGQLTINSAPAALGLPIAVLTAGQNPTNIGNDSSNMIEVALASGAVTKVTITNQGSGIIQQSTLSDLKFCDYPEKSYSATVAPGKQSLNGIRSLNSTQDGVSGENLCGSVDIADAASTATVAFPTNEPNVSFKIPALAVGTKTGAPAEEAYRAHWANKTVSGFDIVLEAAPGAGTTVTVEWMITR